MDVNLGSSNESVFLQGENLHIRMYAELKITLYCKALGTEIDY